MENFNINQLIFNSDGLIPTIAQEKSTNEILMMAYSNKNSIEMTVKTKKLTFGVEVKKNYGLKAKLLAINLILLIFILIVTVTL